MSKKEDKNIVNNTLLKSEELLNIITSGGLVIDNIRIHNLSDLTEAIEKIRKKDNI